MLSLLMYIAHARDECSQFGCDRCANKSKQIVKHVIFAYAFFYPFLFHFEKFFALWVKDTINHQRNECIFSNLFIFTYKADARNRLKVWSYADERAPPGKISAHSEPTCSIVIGCRYCATDEWIIANSAKRNLWKREKKIPQSLVSWVCTFGSI